MLDNYIGKKQDGQQTYPVVILTKVQFPSTNSVVMVAFSELWRKIIIELIIQVIK